jgi:hypothetical protein
MRSRLEARWAAFFDARGWQWDYEPIDLDGYIPDFIISFKRPVLVEVKPVLSFDDFDGHCPKIENSGWNKDYIILGSILFPWGTNCCFDTNTSLGLHAQRRGGEWHYGNAVYQSCISCGKSSIYNGDQNWECLICGDSGDDVVNPVGMRFVREHWNNAGRQVQYHVKSEDQS